MPVTVLRGHDDVRERFAHAANACQYDAETVADLIRRESAKSGRDLGVLVFDDGSWLVCVLDG